MEKIEVVPTRPSETQLDTSKGTHLPLPFYKPINLMETIFKWQPMGKRVIINLPLVGDDRGFLFLIRCSPWIPYVPDVINQYNDPSIANRVLINFEAIVHDINWSDYSQILSSSDATRAGALITFRSDPGVSIVTHSAPPLISKLAEAYRYWRGGLEYRIRTKAGFTHAANLVAMPILGARTPCLTASPNIADVNSTPTPFNLRVPVIYKEKFSYLGAQANSFVNSDLSISRHMQIGYSYSRPTTCVDQFAEVANIINTRADSPILFTANAPSFQDYIGVGVRGTIDNASVGSNQIECEIEIRAAQDFMFGGENVFFNAPSDTSYAMIGTAYNNSRIGDTLVKDEPIVPRKYHNPWLTGASSFIQWDPVSQDPLYRVTGAYTYD
ncbi:MAG: hypothetical protein FPoV2_gp4 [Fushun polycipivirus 2]|nr:MAG: hypothetical protein FPoV2_gp4 [Fushun polycipivirus 2]